MVPEEGVEPTHSCLYGILSPARLPVPPLRPELFRISKEPVLSNPELPEQHVMTIGVAQRRPGDAHLRARGQTVVYY